MVTSSSGTQRLLPRKQSNPDQASWWQALDRIRDAIPKADIDRLVEATAEQVRHTIDRHGWGRVAYGWSGGKDSQALRYVTELAGVTECVLVISQLEVPEFLAWSTDHMPDGLEVITTSQDLDWLAAHQSTHLFPEGRHGADWFRRVQHTGQREYQKRHGWDALLLGRRAGDGNFTRGADEHGQHITVSRGGVRYLPIFDWTHEQTFAAISWYEDLDLAPCYSWPRGFQVGTGPWPARQWTGGVDAGWDEIWQIDRQLVTMCAEDGRFPSAESAVDRNG